MGLLDWALRAVDADYASERRTITANYTGAKEVEAKALRRDQRVERERWEAARTAGPRTWEQRVAGTWGGCNCGHC